MYFVQRSWKYYESNFEAMLKNLSSKWSFYGGWDYYNASFFYVIILRLAFVIPIACSLICILQCLSSKVLVNTMRTVSKYCLEIEAKSELSKVNCQKGLHAQSIAVSIKWKALWKTEHVTWNHESEPQNNHIKEACVIIMSATLERPLWVSIFKHCLKIALIVIPWTLSKREYKKSQHLMVSITRNGNPKSEPQNNHTKETRVIILSATLERSLWASVVKHCFKIALIVSSWILNKRHYRNYNK